MEIKPIQIRQVNIQSAPQVPDWITNPNQSLPITSPVTVQIGLPVLDIPGCVEAHQANNKSKTVGIDDKNGMVTYCDGGVPSFKPIEYNPEDMKFLTPAGIPTYKAPPQEADTEEPLPAPPVIPVIPPSTATLSESECPSPAQKEREPVGSYINGYKKKVVAYEVIGNECVQKLESVGIPEQIIAGVPSAGMFINTGGIAVIATTSALLAKPLADILLKVVKPTVKKIMKKIEKLRGKKPKVLSLRDRRDEQRQRNHAIRKLKGKE